MRKFDNLPDLVNKYKDYKDGENNTISRLVDKLFLKSLYQIKNVVACSIKTSLTDNLCLLYKLKDGIDQNSIEDTPWDDIQQSRNLMFQKLFTYSRQNSKDYQVTGITITEII